MKQAVRVKKNIPEVSIKRKISERFLHMVSELIETEVVKNQRDFALRIDEDQAEFSKIGNPSTNRYIDLEMLWKAVNILGINANHILREDGPTTENLQLEGFSINSGVSGNNNQVNNGKNNTVINGTHHGNIYTAESIINSMPAKEQKETKKYMDNMANKVEALKKTIVQYKKELKDKDKKLMDTQEKYIKLMELQSARKN